MLPCREVSVGATILRRAAPSKISPLGGSDPRSGGAWGHNTRMSEARKTLLLVDGSSYLYRAFFAGGETMSIKLPDGTV